MDGDLWTIVGVLPREFAPQILPRPGDLSVWTPKIIQDHEKRTRGSAWWNVVARLKAGVSIEQAQHELDGISALLAREYPRTNASKQAELVPMREHLMGDVRVPLFVMLGAVVLVLAIGCANVASLLLARGMEREREFAIRAALGAGRARLVRQLVAESLLLSAIAAIAGIALAHWALQAIVALAPSGVVRLHDASIDGRMLAFAAALTTLTATAFGLIPAFQFSNPARDAIRERCSSGPRATLRRGLVVAEIALALILLTGAGLLIRSFGRLMSMDPGFSPANVVAVQVFAWDRNTTADRVRNFFGSTIDRMRTIPGVAAAGAVSAMPFAVANIDIKSTLDIVGRPAATPGEQGGTYVTIATPGYFSAMSIPRREGRFLEPRDNAQAPIVGVISDALRRREWPNESPIGRRLRIRWEGQPIELEVVGVVSQIRHERLDGTPRPEVFLSLAQVPFASMTYVVRGAGDPSVLIDAVKREIWAVDPLQTVYESGSVAAMVDASVVRERFSMTLMTAFALVALLLCASGIYGIISFTTAQRTREIGVRMALGADGQAIQRMVLREGSAVIAAGVALGLAGALAGARLLQSLLFEVRPGDPLTMAVVCTVLSVVGLSACYVPARRATRVDPLVALRNE
jgi:putative ABC transport system permease protein